jgi:hypothetical protein
LQALVVQFHSLQIPEENCLLGQERKRRRRRRRGLGFRDSGGGGGFRA